MSIKLLLIFIVTIIILLIIKSFLIYIYENSSVVYKNESNINVEQAQNNLINRGQQSPDEALIKNTDIQPIDFSKIEFTEFNLDKPKQRKSLSSTECTVTPLVVTK